MKRRKTDIELFNESACLKQEAISTYLYGILDEQQNIIVEEHLSECVLCKDAVEGLKIADNEKTTALLANIQHEIREKSGLQRKNKTIPIYSKIAFAASFLILIGLFTNYQLGFFPFSSNILARNLDKWSYADLSVPQRPMPEISTTNTIIVKENNKENATKRTEYQQTQRKENTKKETVNTSVIPEDLDTFITEETEAKETFAEESKMITIEKAIRSAQQMDNPVAGTTNSTHTKESYIDESLETQTEQKKKAITGILQGQITDEYEEPIPFVNLLIGKNGEVISVTQTDSEGNYKINFISSGVYDIRTSLIGFSDQIIENVTLNTYETKSIDVVMISSNLALSVLNSSTNKSRNMFRQSKKSYREKLSEKEDESEEYRSLSDDVYYDKVVETAEDISNNEFSIESVEQPPQFSFESHQSVEDFITENLVYPQTGEKQKEGIVYVTFTIRKNGKISKPKIIRSLGEKYDNEALRLAKLTDGKWIAGKENGKAVRVGYILAVRF